MEYKDNEELQESEDSSYDEEKLKSCLKAEVDDAQDFINQIGEERAESTDYYLGNEPDNTSELQSQYISTDVRDSVLFLLPSIMRTFFGSKKVVEFMPQNQEDIPLAEQQTDYINHIITQKNNGFKVIYDVFKDALIRKSGFVKAFWDESLTASTHEYSDLSYEAYMALVMDKDVEIISEKINMESFTVISQETQEEITQEKPVSYDLKIRRVKSKSQVCIESIPPEEVLISRYARSLEESPYVGHRTVKTVSDLVAMGYDKEEIEMHAGSGNYVDTHEERQARNPYDNLDGPDRQDVKGNDVLYIEHYLNYDLDEDGIDELIKVCTIGEGLNIINVEQWDELPIVMFCPDPEPHTSIGSCPTDYLKPIQAAKSQIMRDTLDSLGHSIFPRFGVVEGQVNIDDVLNTDIGQPIRMRQAGAVQSFNTPFVGKEAFPVLNYLDSAKENRTGVSKASAGLNAEALQSTTKTAVSATMSASQGRLELICRHFAESGMKPLFRLVNGLVCKHQDAEDIFRLNNQFIPVDPRYWDADKDVVVNVAISKSSDDEKLKVLTLLATKQEQILQQLGPQNPLVDLQQYSNTIARMVELAGFKDATTFINTKVAPMPPKPAKSDPAELLAQAEIQKTQVSAQKAVVDAETDRMKIIMEDDLERDKSEAEIRLKAAELKAKYGAQVNIAEINALMERDKEAMRSEQKVQAAGLFNEQELTS
tara:strand:+ start:14847 stop:16973 length:2127 start_codon:yes stop_codon:yes gene_type:complete